MLKVSAYMHKHKNWGVLWKKYDGYSRSNQNYLSIMWIVFNNHLKKAKLELRNLYYHLYIYSARKAFSESAINGSLDEEQETKKLRINYNKFAYRMGD